MDYQKNPKIEVKKIAIILLEYVNL